MASDKKRPHLYLVGEGDKGKEKKKLKVHSREELTRRFLASEPTSKLAELNEEDRQVVAALAREVSITELEAMRLFRTRDRLRKLMDGERPVYASHRSQIERLDFKELVNKAQALLDNNDEFNRVPLYTRAIFEVLLGKAFMLSKED